jgi:hypothetical protein
MIVLDELEPQALKRVAAFKKARVERGVELATGQLVSVSGWLSASLFAINGGAAVTTFGITDKLDDSFSPLIFFGAGLLCALLSGVVIQWFLSRSLAPAEDLLTLLNDAESTGAIDGTEFNTVLGQVNSISRWNWIAPAVGWVSAALFLVGATILAFDLAHPDHIEQTTCRSLQKGMLSRGERAKEDGELYRTIGCRFQST